MSGMERNHCVIIFVGKHLSVRNDNKQCDALTLTIKSGVADEIDTNILRCHARYLVKPLVLLVTTIIRVEYK